jgi:AraC family transcriptional regulator
MSVAFSQGHFAGRVRRSRRVAGSLLAETTYAPGLEVAMHEHDRTIICLALDGGFIERRDHETDRCVRGELLYHPGGECHGHSFIGRTALFNIQLAPEWLAAMEVVGAPKRPQVIRSGLAPRLASRIALESQGSDVASGLVVEDAMLSLVAELAQLRHVRERNAPAWLDRVLEALDAGAEASHANNRADQGLAGLARIADVHPAHLARTFRARMGCTTGEYARRRRLDRSRAALIATKRPVSEIAADAGFFDQAHFTKAFKRAFGAPPATFRANVGRR